MESFIQSAIKLHKSTDGLRWAGHLEITKDAQFQMCMKYKEHGVEKLNKVDKQHNIDYLILMAAVIGEI